MTKHQHLQFARRFARLMDNQFSILGFRFGLDGIVGMIPGLGDLIGLALSSYLIWIAANFNVPASKLLHMIINVLIDLFIGSVPVIGDLGDIFFKANQRNLQILEEHTALNETSTVIEGELISD